MGTFFPDSDEFPDHVPLGAPPFTGFQAVAGLAIVGVSVGLCPVHEGRHEHVPNEHVVEWNLNPPGLSVSSTSGNRAVAVSDGRLGFLGRAPGVKIRG